MKILKYVFLVLILTTTSKALAIEINAIKCKTAKSAEHTVEISFFRPVNPLKPFIGFLFFTANLSVFKNETKVYQNLNIRMTPEIYTTDINLRGDANGVYLRLYPQITNDGEFSHYTGQVFINDLDKRAYFNFRDSDDKPGLYCQ